MGLVVKLLWERKRKRKRDQVANLSKLRRFEGGITIGIREDGGGRGVFRAWGEIKILLL